MICFSDSIFYSNINTDINIFWTTNLGQFYDVLSPSNTAIYNVSVNAEILLNTGKDKYKINSNGDIVPNTDMNKYMVNSKGTEQIDISVLNVSQNDSGIYQSVRLQNSKVDGCCLLIITGLYIMFYFFNITKYI